MKLIVGLGNPGPKYEKTRHNFGFRAVDFLAGNEKWGKNKKADCLYLKKEINGQEVELIKPLAFMNNSGKTVGYIQKKHYLKPEDIIVIHDDVDLPLGEIKIQQGRGSAGHKGVQSIIETLGTNEFTRVRLGIGLRNKKQETRNKIDTEKFVLEKFASDEKKTVEQTIKKAARIIQTAL